MNAIALLEPPVASAFFGKFPSLTPAQEAAIPHLACGKNVVLSSGTGSGKTEAVVAPLLNASWKVAAARDELVLLYVAPTKALINDLEKRLYQPLAYLGLRVGIRHGDRDDVAAGRHPHLLLTTPESLDVMLFRNDPCIRSVRAVVIDEVHLLYNTQRGLQLSILLARLRTLVARPIQWAALSATIGSLEHIRDFLLKGDAAEFVECSGHRPIDAHVRHIACEEELSKLLASATAGGPTKLLIFVNSRRECERVATIAGRVGPLHNSVFPHYSSLSADVRVEAEKGFSTAKTAVCIATSTLELGIDIGDIDAVLLWGLPGGLESFLQRIGRGNRRAKKANVVCLVPDTSESPLRDAILFAAIIDSAKEGKVPLRYPYRLYGAAAQQCLDLIGSRGGAFTRIADLSAVFTHQPHLDRKAIEGILAELASRSYLQRHGFKNRYGALEKLHELIEYKLIYGNFPVASQTVDVYDGGKLLGAVPAANLLRVTRGTRVQFKARAWQVVKASGRGIHLELTKAGPSAMNFIYGGSAPTVDTFICNRAWNWLMSSERVPGIFSQQLQGAVTQARERLQAAVSPGQIPYVCGRHGVSYFTFGGHLVNRAIGLFAGKPDFTAKDHVCKVPSPIGWSELPKEPSGFGRVFSGLFEQSEDQSLYQQLLPQGLQVEEGLQAWLNDTAISATIERIAASKPVAVEAETLMGLA